MDWAPSPQKQPNQWLPAFQRTFPNGLLATSARDAGGRHSRTFRSGMGPKIWRSEHESMEGYGAKVLGILAGGKKWLLETHPSPAAIAQVDVLGVRVRARPPPRD